MKVAFEHEGFNALTDDTQALDEKTLFLKTHQNTPYFEKLEVKPKHITSEELYTIWKLDTMRVVGITGTNGKTTVAGAIYSFLLDLDHRVGLQGTRGLFANEKRLEAKSMTTPSILETMHNMKLTFDEGCEYFVMEVSSHGIDQKRIEGITFALKVHTNVTSDHLDYHGTVEEYRRIKSLFFADETLKLLNKDDLKNITYNVKNAHSYGVDEPATYKVQAFTLIDGITAGIKHLQNEASFDSPMVGLFNLYNLMAAIGSVHLLTQKPLQEVCDVVGNFGGVSGRMQVLSRKPLVIVDFAHTADGMHKVFEAMRDKEMVVVFGAGGNRDKEKRPLMGKVAGAYAKRIFVTSDNPRDEVPEMILEDILVGLRGREDDVVATPDRRLAIKMALESMDESEVLLVLGKGDEDTQEIKGVKHPFDDREVIGELLTQLA